MSIYYQEEDVKAPLFKKRETTKWIKTVAEGYGKKVGEISYLFCTDAKILEVNRQYLQHDYYTDIITFDYSEGDTISGDIFMSLDTVRSNSEQFKTDFQEEFFRILIHGVLHLCGVNDKSPEERANMTDRENKALMLNPLLVN